MSRSRSQCSTTTSREAVAVLSVAHNPVAEAGTATVAVTITTARDEQPREDAGSITVVAVDGTALAGSDYEAIPVADTMFTFDLGTFGAAHVDIDDDPVREDFRWVARLSETVLITDDTEEEDDETFTVSMALTTEHGRGDRSGPGHLPHGHHQ